MGITKTILLPAGRNTDSRLKQAATILSLRLRGRIPKQYVFFANELPDMPEAKAVIEKYLKRARSASASRNSTWIAIRSRCSWSRISRAITECLC